MEQQQMLRKEVTAAKLLTLVLVLVLVLTPMVLLLQLQLFIHFGYKMLLDR